MDTTLRTLHILLLTLTSVSCAALPTTPPPAPKRIAKSSLVWPKPPHQARIRFVDTLARPTDLGVKPSFFKRLGDLLAGPSEEYFVRPTGVAADAHGIYVADPGAQALWIVDTKKGMFRPIRTAGKEALISPVAVATDNRDRIFLADSFLSKVFIFNHRTGKLDAVIEHPEMRRPAGLAYDTPRERLLVADSLTHRVLIFDRLGKLSGTIGRRGTGKGEFNFPTHVTVDSEGTVYVNDSLGFRVQIFSPDLAFVGLFGRHGDTSGDFTRPKGIAVDSDGHIYVVETLFDSVQIFDRTGRFLLSFGERGLEAGQFWLPGGIFIDSENRIYVADSYNQRIQIFKYLPSGNNG